MRRFVTQRGNILFLILLAVVLFAALSYAVTSSLRGGGNDASSESVKLMASRLIQYGILVENTFTRANVGGNFPEWGFDFDDGAGPSMSTANSTCTSTNCRIFTTSSRDGLITSQSFDNKFIDPRVGSTSDAIVRFYVIDLKDVGTSLPDLVMLIPDLRTDICQTINEMLIGQKANPHIGYSAGTYSGTLSSFPAGGTTISNSFFVGRTAGCLGRENASPANGGQFYQVILAR